MSQTRITIEQVQGLNDAVDDKASLVGAVFTGDVTVPKLIFADATEMTTAPVGGGGGGEVNTASNVGTGTGKVFKDKVVSDLRFKSVAAGTGITVTNGVDDVTIATTAQNNTASNLGTGEGLFASKAGSDLQFKSVKAGANVTISSDATSITIDSGTLSAGEANTASNLGGGAPLYDSKSGVDLRFRSLLAGTGISVSSVGGGATTITNTSPGEVNTAVNLGTGEGLFTSKSGVQFQFKSLKAGTGVTLSPTGTELTISAAAGSSKWTAQTGYSEYNLATSLDTSRFWHFNSGGYQSFVPPKGSNIATLGSYLSPASWVSTGYQHLKRVIRTLSDYTGTPTSYTILPELSADVVVLDSEAGYQQSFTTDSGGRTMSNAYHARVMHRTKGDMNGFFATVSVMGHNQMGSVSGNWTGQPSGVVIAGEVHSNAAKTNVYGSEFQLYDNGFQNVTGIGAVYGLYRTNTTAAGNHAWLGVRVQSNGSQYAEVAFQASGLLRVGLDTTAITQDGVNNCAIAMAIGQRLYLGTPVTSWPNLSPTLTGPYFVSDGTYVTLANGTLNFNSHLSIASPVTASSATAGAASALPANPFTYIRIKLDGVNYKIPVYNS